jgi:hypothetical protein
MPISEPREDVPDRWRCTRCRQCRSCSATCLPTRLTAMDREKTAYAASCAVSDCRKHRKALGFGSGPGLVTGASDDIRHRQPSSGPRRKRVPASAPNMWAGAGCQRAWDGRPPAPSRREGGTSL